MDVYRLKKDFPHLSIEINGGITTLEQAQEHLQAVDAVMIGRAAYDNPYLLATVDQAIYQATETPLTRHEVVQGMLPYAEDWVAKGGKLQAITRHLFSLFAGCPGTKVWKRYITEQAYHQGAGVEVIKDALALIS